MAAFRGGNLNFFLEQWERVIRWKNQCNATSHYLAHGANQLDFYEAFFINAYHLRDWLAQWLKENNRPDILKKMRQDFKTKRFLRALKDICNGCKHFTLNQNIEIGKQYAIAREYLWGEIRNVILIGGEKYPLNDLLKDVFTYWNDFFKKYGLDQLKHDIRGPLIPFD